MGCVMRDPAKRPDPSDTEAAAWHTRLSTRRVSQATLEEFFAWRRTPANAAAYQRVERIWAGTGDLARDPEIALAVEQAWNRKAQPKVALLGRRSVVLAAATVTVALMVGGAVWFQGRAPVYSTAIGEQRLIQLTDGSTVKLDTNSRLQVRFRGRERHLELQQGQALFDVAHDASRPFIVEAGETRVTAVGTVFDVRRWAAGTAVTLVSGVVQVDSEATSGGAPRGKRLVAGQQAWVTAAGEETRTVDVTTATSWAEGRLVFRDTPLHEAVAEMNRYLPAGIELDAGASGAVAVHGSFKIGDRDAFVSAASDVFGLKAVATEGGGVRLVPDPNKSASALGAPPR